LINILSLNVKVPFLSFSLTYRLFKWARTSWGRGRSTWPTFGPANGRALQQLTCPSAWNKSRGSAPLPGLAGWPRLPMCTAMPPHSVQEPRTGTLSNSKSWHSMVIGSHHCVPTHLEPSSALDAPIKTDCLMLSWAQTNCTVSAVKKKKKERKKVEQRTKPAFCSMQWIRLCFTNEHLHSFTCFLEHLLALHLNYAMHGWENQQSRMYKSVIKRTIAITQGKKNKLLSKQITGPCSYALKTVLKEVCVWLSLRSSFRNGKLIHIGAIK